MRKVILIRVDSTPEIGAGHLMRMIALGQVLRDGGHDVHIATMTAPDRLPSEIGEFSLHRMDALRPGADEDVRRLTELARQLAADWIVLDGQAFDTVFQRTVRAGGFALLSVDDVAPFHFVSDAILNQNYGAERTVYSAEPYTRKYLGIAYLMLRREFRLGPAGEPRRAPATVLVTLGSTDVSLAALARFSSVLRDVSPEGIRFRLIVGHRGRVPAEVAKLQSSQPHRFEVLGHVDDMAAAIRSADAAICSGGSTVWELMCMGVPFMTIALNAAQVAFLSMLERDGLCVSLGHYEDIGPADAARISTFLADTDLRSALARAGRSIGESRRSAHDLLRIFAGD